MTLAESFARYLETKGIATLRTPSNEGNMYFDYTPSASDRRNIVACHGASAAPPELHSPTRHRMVIVFIRGSHEYAGETAEAVIDIFKPPSTELSEVTIDGGWHVHAAWPMNDVNIASDGQLFSAAIDIRLEIRE